MATSVPAVPEKLGKARSVCWTLHNYDDEHVTKLRNYAKTVKYMVFGYEICPDTKRPHLQGYVVWENPRSLDAFKHDISNTLHIEQTRGSPQQASDYCKYEDYPENKVPNKFEEFGELPRQGARTDWRVALKEIKDGIPVEEVIENQPQLLPCVRALDTYKSKLLKPLNRDVTVIVLWGESGSGKSRFCYENYPNLYSKPPGKWWDGYTGQDTILLDDYYGYLPYSNLLNVLDRYPYHAEIKGGFVWAQWRTVLITSNNPPNTWYASPIGYPAALQRRLNKIFFYSIDASPRTCLPSSPSSPQDPSEEESSPQASHDEAQI